MSVTYFKDSRYKFANIACLVLISFTLSSCATKPEDDPAYVSPMMYSDHDCSQLKAEMHRVSTRLDQVTRSQESGQALNAAVTVFTIASGYEVGESSTAIEARRLRNQSALLEQRSIEKKCKI